MWCVHWMILHFSWFLKKHVEIKFTNLKFYSIQNQPCRPLLTYLYGLHDLGMTPPHPFSSSSSPSSSQVKLGRLHSMDWFCSPPLGTSSAFFTRKRDLTLLWPFSPPPHPLLLLIFIGLCESHNSQSRLAECVGIVGSIVTDENEQISAQSCVVMLVGVDSHVLRLFSNSLPFLKFWNLKFLFSNNL